MATKFYPPTTLMGRDNILSDSEVDDMLIGKNTYRKPFAYIGPVDAKSGPQGIGQAFFDLNLEWYKNKRPMIAATDSTIWKAVETGLTALERDSEVAKFYHLAQLPVTMILFPHTSCLGYKLPRSIVADKDCDGRYRFFKTIDQPKESPLRHFAGMFDLSWFPEKSIVENDLAQSCLFFSEVFLLGLSFVLEEDRIPNLQDLVYNLNESIQSSDTVQEIK